MSEGRDPIKPDQTRRVILSNWIGIAERLSKVTKVPQDEVLKSHTASYSQLGGAGGALYLILSNKLCSAMLSGRGKKRRKTKK